ncbi:MAG: RNA polymerase sigma factor region1.1 domain-containing protein, partial [Limnohabitans sp.]
MPAKKIAKAAKVASKPTPKSLKKPANKTVTKATTRTSVKSSAKSSSKTSIKPASKPNAKTAAKVASQKTVKPAAKPATKPSVKATSKAKPVDKAANKPATKPSAERAKPPKSSGKAAGKSKASVKKALEDDDIVDLEAEFADENGSSGEKVKPLRMKISKAKERALMKEFGLDEAILSEEDLAKRRSRLKTLIKLGKTRGYLTHGEISDHLPDKLVDAETLEVVITMLNDMGVAVFEQTPDAEMLIINNTGPTVASEEEAEEEAEAALSTVDSEFGRTTDPVRMYMREMGTVELLTREGEIEIAKRIEGGLMAMMEAISASPATVAEILRMAADIREDKVVISTIVDGFTNADEADDYVAEEDFD